MANLVAVYGSLRAGLHNHVVLGDAPYVSMGEISGFTMYSLGAYPALTRGEGTSVVELYDVACMDDLDSLEGFPTYYTRKQVKVDTPDGAKMAWVYYMKRELMSNPVVESGDWKKYLKSGGE